MMGPIEQGLRAIESPLCVLWAVRCPDTILCFAIDVAEELGFGEEFSGTPNVDADVISYAIEAAEALGL